MKNILTFFLLIGPITLGYCQSEKLSKIISDSLDNVDFEVRMNRLATNSNQYSAGDKFRISARFVIQNDGTFTQVEAKAPSPEIENLVENKLKNIQIPEDLLVKLTQENPELKFALPLWFQVASESEISRMIKKDKKKKARRKNKS